MFTKYFVYWIAIPGSEQGAVAKPESREYSTLQWAEKRCEAVFNGWNPQLTQVSALTEEAIESVRQELIAAGLW